MNTLPCENKQSTPRQSPVTKTRLVLALGMALILALLAISYTHRKAPADLPIYGVLPDFSLTAQDGSTISKSLLLGHPWIADFIFTRCAGQCPRMSMSMAGLQSDLAAMKNLLFVSFSVDPKWDTPDELAKYAKVYGADPTRWFFVTGPQQDVYGLSRKGFKLGVDESTPDAPNIAAEPIFHSSRLVLVDSQCRVRGYYDALEPEGLRRLRSDVWKLSDTKH